MGLTFKNRGHLGSRYIYIYIFYFSLHAVLLFFGNLEIWKALCLETSNKTFPVSQLLSKVSQTGLQFYAILLLFYSEKKSSIDSPASEKFATRIPIQCCIAKIFLKNLMPFRFTAFDEFFPSTDLETPIEIADSRL